MDRTDTELVAGIMLGDESASRELYRRYARRARAFFLRTGFSPPDADDLTQDTFVRGYRALHTFDAARGPFYGWFQAIATNVARRAFRKADRENFDISLADDVFAGADGAGGPAEEREELTALDESIKALDPESARLVRLRYVDGRTTRGIAAETGLPEATVRWRLRKALEHLEKDLNAKGIIE